MPNPWKKLPGGLFHLEEKDVSGLDTELKSQCDLKLISLVAMNVRQGKNSVFCTSSF